MGADGSGAEIAPDGPGDGADRHDEQRDATGDVPARPLLCLTYRRNRIHPWHNSHGPGYNPEPHVITDRDRGRVSNDRNQGGFEDLFEPFELEEYPTDAEATGEGGPLEPVAPVLEEATPTMRCPSCGALNPAHNRHCEECGARLSQSPLPVAPPPMIRSTPGGRALGILFGVVLLVALFALFLNIFRGGGDETAATTTTLATSTTVSTVIQTELQAASVEASSSFPELEADLLIDGDPTTYWNDASQRGVGATLTFTFAQPVAIGEMELQNITEDEPFRRNYRIKDFQVTVDDLAIELPYTMPDNNEPFRVPLKTLETRRLTITVLDTYPGEPVGDQPSFIELALAEVRFFGTVSR